MATTREDMIHEAKMMEVYRKHLEKKWGRVVQELEAARLWVILGFAAAYRNNNEWGNDD